MRKVTIIIGLLLICTASFSQRTLNFTDVMLFCGDRLLTTSENWQYADAKDLNIQHVTEKRYFKLYGRITDFNVNYWTWKNERYGSGTTSDYSYMQEQNDGLSISVFFNNDELVLLLENNTDMYIFTDLTSLSLSFCDNEDEGVKNVRPIGNSLRNRNFLKYDYIMMPPKKKAKASFYSLMQLPIFPTSIPRGTIIQYQIFSYAFSTNPWNLIETMIPQEINGKKLYIEEEGSYYFSLQGQYLSNTSFGYKRAIGFESRYHCKLY